MAWICPLCKQKFAFFEVLKDLESINASLAPHLYLVHGHELCTFEYRQFATMADLKDITVNK